MVVRDPDAARLLVADGPLRALLCALHVSRAGAPLVLRPAAAFVVAFWIPFVALGAAVWGLHRRVDPLLLDASAHARLLVAVPSFFAADLVLHHTVRRALRQFLACGLTRDPVATRRLVRAAARRRDSALAEGAFLVAACLGGAAALFGITPAAGVVPSAPGGALSPARVFYAALALPAFQFLLYRALWRWAIWCRLSWGLARLDVAPAPAHPDRAGGLTALAQPIAACALVTFGVSAVLAGAWGTRLWRRDLEPAALAAPFGGFALGAMLVAFASLLGFVACLYRTRREGMRRYSRLALDYARCFDRRWIDRAPDDTLLGSPDIQSLADMANAYRGIERMRVVPLEPESVPLMVVAILLPMLPMLAARVPTHELFARLGHVLLGRLP